MNVARDLKALAKPSKAFEHQRFFKTGSGQYGEGGVFLGLTVPEVRVIARNIRVQKTMQRLHFLKLKN